ncbi:hypothetical protein H5410_022364 [Solanum commersonii]|uniref:Uncharacterized protein n=1 Tax=Solanum commersonii TaxID=4109 RepID=A0A9J5ZDR9_SOLCO|nr:hypothetical protein H5410_022364 [Solanum commersonii]
MELLCKRSANDLFQFKGVKESEIWMKSERWILSLLKRKNNLARALKAGIYFKELLTGYCKLIGHKYPDHICTKCSGEDNIIPDVHIWNDQIRRKKIRRR